jgi:hypothetical protein
MMWAQEYPPLLQLHLSSLQLLTNPCASSDNVIFVILQSCTVSLEESGTSPGETVQLCKITVSVLISASSVMAIKAHFHWNWEWYSHSVDSVHYSSQIYYLKLTPRTTVLPQKLIGKGTYYAGMLISP